MPAKPNAQPATKPEPGLKKGDHVFLVDGSSYIFRAYFQSMNQGAKYNFRSDGVPTGAVRMFCVMIWRLLTEMKPEERPTHLAVVFDKSEKTFRTEMYPAYKAHRPDPPGDLIPQFPLIREAVRAFDLPCVEQGGFEADDLIATYVRHACEAGATATIVASDKDLMQLVNDCVVMYDTMKDQKIGIPEVIDKFGVPPDKVIDVQALIGDTSDNVPGVAGIGPKAAATLITELGSLDFILEHTKSPDVLETKLRESLTQAQGQLDQMAGEPVKIGSGSQVGRVLAERFGVVDLPKDKKNNIVADAEAIEKLCQSGNAFCQLLVRARNLSRAIGGTIEKVIKNEDTARLSKKLVTLDDHVALDVPLGELAVHQPDYKNLIAFLKTMEFTTLMRRVAEFAGIDPAAIEVEAPAAGGRAAQAPPQSAVAAPEGDAATRGSTAPELPLGRPPQPGDASFQGPGEAPSQPAGTPQMVAEALTEAARGTRLDKSKYEIVRTADRLKQWIDRARETGLLAIDVSAAGTDPMQAEMCGISLAVGPGEACYVPLGHRQGGEGGAGELFRGDIAPDQLAEFPALKALKPLLADPGVLKIGHDVKFAWQLFALRGIETVAYDDVMLMSYALDAGRQNHGLGALSTRILGHGAADIDALLKAGKSRITFDAVGIERAAEYAAERADIVWRLWAVLKQRLVAERVTTVYETLERPLVAVLARMERRGIAIDRDVLSRLSGEFAQEAAGLEAEINDLAGEKVNPGSPKQLGDILFGKLGLPGGTKTRTGQWATGARALEDLAEQGNQLPQKILDWRQVSKLKSTYTDALPGFVHPTTHRVHTNYALAATTTGRLSSSDPNLQNIPVRTEEGRKIRRAFIAAPGTRLVSADYSQIELRLLAEIAGIEPLQKAFRDGLDIHAMTASEMFGVPIKDMPGEVRRRAKAINFGIIYGISAFGLANQLGIGRDEAGAYIKKYFERFPGIRDYMEESKRYAKDNGYVLTLFGRKCHYPDIKAPNASIRAFNERAAINARLQGTAADIIRRAMIRMEDAFAKNKLGARMLLQVHDELVFEVADDEVARTIPVVKKVMEEAPMPAVSMSVPLQVDARAAGNWDEAH